MKICHTTQKQPPIIIKRRFSMICNELIFAVHATVIMAALAGACWYGKEALIALICLCGVLANLFVIKQITLFGFDVVSTDVFALVGLVGLTFIQEFFGQAAARKTIIINFALLFFYLVMTSFHLWYAPNIFDVTQAHFAVLLAPTFRIIAASATAYLISQASLLFLTGISSSFTQGKYFTARTLLSVALAQLIDTLLFSFLALYGMVHAIGHIILVSYSVKLIVLACATPCIALMRRLITSSGNHS